MAERLEQIAKSVNPATFPWINAERAKYYHRESAKIDDQSRALQLRLQFAYELLWAGKTSDAIREFTLFRRFFELPNMEVPPLFQRQVRDALATSHLRLALQENCLARRGADSCLMPIQGSGIRAIQTGSRAAITELTAALEYDREDLGARWLLNLAYMTLGEYPDKVPPKWLIPPKAFESDYEIKRFRDVAPELGLNVIGHAGGSIMEDFDGDGYLDIMVSSWGLRDQMRYFRNNGDGTFTERTKEAGLIGEVSGLNMSHADYDNDGYPDVLVLRGAWLMQQGRHPNSLLHNNGNGTFEDVTEEAGLLCFHPSHTGAWGDYDNDGWLDLFIGNESLPHDRHPCQLFHNNADGTFSDVASSVGIVSEGYVKGAAWGDYNNDGLLDLYISRLGQANVLYRNAGLDPKGRWRFTDVSNQAGVTEPLYSFATWFWDYDNDGWLDIFVAPLGGMQVAAYSLPDVAADYLGLPTKPVYPCLYRNNHDGTFSDAAKSAKMQKVLLAMGANFGDLDNDGFLDCYFGTGEPDLRTLVPNRMFRNAGGRFFQDVTTSGGFGHLQKGHGISFGDIDNDGDQDIYAKMGGNFSGDLARSVLFENPGNSNHWITLKLEGVQTNRAAIGVRIRITVVCGTDFPVGQKTDSKVCPTGSRDVYATVSTGGSFGCSTLQQEIGLGQARAIRTIEITWPVTGKVQTFKDVGMDQVLKTREGDLTPVAVELKRINLSARRPAGAEGTSVPRP